jgi:hypothetical protein
MYGAMVKNINESSMMNVSIIITARRDDSTSPSPTTARRSSPSHPRPLRPPNGARLAGLVGGGNEGGVGDDGWTFTARAAMT